MRYRILFPVICFFLLPEKHLDAQIRLGQWRTHLPYQYCTLVEATDDRVYCSATGGLFYYGLDDNSVEKLSKIDGLSDNGVAAMRWDNSQDVLILAYRNSNIDIIRGGAIVNLPDIMKKQIPGDKSVYDIYFSGQYAYLSTGFGIVVLNLGKNEISETYYIGENGEALKVNQVVSDGTYLFAATESGILRGLLSDPFLVDFNAWEKLTGFPDPDGPYSGISFFAGALFASYKDPAGEQDQVFYTTGEAWVPYPYFTGAHCRELKSQGEYLTLVDEVSVNLISDTYLLVKQLPSGDPRSASIDGSGDIWAADHGDGLVTNKGGGTWSVIPDGPYSALVNDMASGGEILYAVQGGVTGSWNNQFTEAVLEIFRNDTWDYESDPDSRDFLTLAVDPGNPSRVFAASWGYGLHEYRLDETHTVYGEGNSSLQSIIPGSNFIRIGGVAFDPSGNLWMTNTGVAEPISVMKPDGSWRSFRADNLISDYTLSRLLVTSSGHKWVILARANGLFAMDDNGTIDEPSDDTYRRISVVDRNGKVITNDVRSFAEDHSGNLWLGTNQGVLVIYSPWRLFTEGSVYAQQILVPREGEANPDGTIPADVLLGEQVVTAIEVDGANRKWLGTASGGAYLVSDDGLDLVKEFNTINSPLLSDNISDICVDGVTGEVFFGTDEGIISYKGEALAGSDRYQNVVVYPNPVRETHEGPVAIKGLVENTTVKITDMSGNLVYETESLGGQALWDGTNFKGTRVATGVYMIYLSNADGTLAHVTKLLFIH